MGKVNIIIESDNIDTAKLYDATKELIMSEHSIEVYLGIEYKILHPDVRIYIVPDDE